MASQDKINMCEMHGDEFVCTYSVKSLRPCKYSSENSYSCCHLFFNMYNNTVLCTSDPANKEAAETAVRIGQEYLDKIENDAANEEPTTEEEGLNNERSMR